MKAILITDMPKSCDECMLCDTHEITENGYDYANCYALHQDIKAKFDSDGRFMIKKPKHCPLKPMPEKLNAFEEWIKVERPHREQYVSKELENQVIGYNRCIDEILVEQE